ncbi:hypothetical protein DSO57_1032042 [Entomophthora muscae]|uniref:Uncharacterized protein n=1 Tax=Entomophthora muscae TaxID=34485 RepID=A0ACC2S2L4_9FUNG|nr:hypothetical protein DSO57_1032042 [Entomophthora muscae]
MSIQILHSSATSSIQALANACFFSFTSRSSLTDKACFSGITATIPTEGDEPSVVMFVGTFFTEHKLPSRAKPQKDTHSQPCRIENHPTRASPTPTLLDLDGELSLMFNTNCHI